MTANRPAEAVRRRWQKKPRLGIEGQKRKFGWGKKGERLTLEYEGQMPRKHKDQRLHGRKEG